jgi:hypothetical protein
MKKRSESARKNPALNRKRRPGGADCEHQAERRQREGQLSRQLLVMGAGLCA